MESQLDRAVPQMRSVPDALARDGQSLAQSRLSGNAKKRKLLPSAYQTGGSVHVNGAEQEENKQPAMQPSRKMLQCKYCPYTCTRTGSMTIHLRKHTGEKPYECGECDYRTARKSSLVVHLRTHTGEKPYPCTTCGNRFATRSHLNRHLRIHSGEKPFFCEQCDFKSTTKSHLTRHMLKHTGEKPFACTICDYKCSRKSNLIRHSLKHKSKEERAKDPTSRKNSQDRVAALTRRLKEKNELIRSLHKQVEQSVEGKRAVESRMRELEKELREAFLEREKKLIETNTRLVERLRAAGVPELEATDLLHR